MIKLPMKQPAAGIVAGLTVMALCLLFISLFSFGTFTGWVAYTIQCMIPMQVVIGVTWGSGQPAFAQRSQPVKGLLLVLLSVVVGVIVAAILHATIGGRVSPPAPMVIMFTIIQVLSTFALSIIWGNWPFSGMFKNPVAAGMAMLVAAYLITYVIFRVFFDFGFMQGAPVYVPSLDPHGLFNAWNVVVWYITVITIMFMMLHFDLWPLTSFPSVMKQPTLGIVWTLVVVVLGTAAYQIGVTLLGMDVVVFMLRAPIPFIFGTILVLNVLQNSVFSSFKQPVKGILNTLLAAALGVGLAQIYAALSPYTTAVLKSGPPSYDLEIWTASALLGVTFPCLIFAAEFFKLWPFKKAEAA
jgi:hypothetical protein